MKPYVSFDIKAHVQQFESLFPTLTEENALERIAQASNLSPQTILSKKRTAPVSFWRQALFYTWRKRTQEAYNAIASHRAPRHSGANVRHGCEQMQNYRDAYGTS